MCQDIAKANEELASLPAVSEEDVPFYGIPDAANEHAVAKLTLIRSGNLEISKSYFLRDQGSELLYTPDHCFLIEKALPDGTTYRLVWDLGLRPEFKHKTYAWLNELFKAKCRANIPQILQESGGVEPASINAAIVSHLHFDHLGDISAFPSSTELILGPTAPEDIESQAEVLDVDVADLKARKVRILNKKTDPWVKVGAFDALDYFNDGSVRILSSPGHTPHHISCLVRVSLNKYFLLASDTCHHCSFIHAAVPQQFGLFQWDDSGKLHAMMDQPQEAYTSIAKTRRMEKEPNVTVWIAHDLTIDKLIEPDKEVVPVDPEWFDKIKTRSVSV